MSLLLAMLMFSASLVGTVALSTSQTRIKADPIVLDAAVPLKFGSWQVAGDGPAQVINPQTKEKLDKLYSQILSRTYVNGAGYRIMLSVAYGSDQRGELQAHRPDDCYPAQGFKVLSLRSDSVGTPFGRIDVKRLDTVLGPRREPLTYWLTMGDSAASTRLERRLQELRLGLTGRIPDGLIFRVSSIDPVPESAYPIQDEFVRELLAATTPKDRLRLSGLGATPSP